MMCDHCEKTLQTVQKHYIEREIDLHDFQPPSCLHLAKVMFANGVVNTPSFIIMYL